MTIGDVGMWSLWILTAIMVSFNLGWSSSKTLTIMVSILDRLQQKFVTSQSRARVKVWSLLVTIQLRCMVSSYTENNCKYI